jgi:hypothetical protein
MLMRHRWPFLVHRFVYVAVDESSEVRPLVFGEATIKENNGSECAGFCGKSELGLIEVVPDLYGDETDKKAEDDQRARSRRSA